MLAEYYEIDSESLKVKSKKPRLLTRVYTHNCEGCQTLKPIKRAKRKSIQSERIGNLQKIEDKLRRAEERRTSWLEMKKLKNTKLIGAVCVKRRLNEEREFRRRLEIEKQLTQRHRNWERRRTGSSPTADTCASKIQSWYRLKKLLPLSRLHHKVGLTAKSASTLSFTELTNRVQNPVVVKSTTFTIMRAKRTTSTKTNFQNPGRVLLSAYVIATYPGESISPQSSFHQSLVQLAKSVVSAHDRFITLQNPGYINESAHIFMTAFKSYYQVFMNYKDEDRVKMVRDLVNEFIGLDKLYCSVIERPGEFLESIRKQQLVFKARIERLKGLQDLRDGRKEFMKAVEGEFQVSWQEDILGNVDEIFKPKVIEDMVSQVTNQQLAHELVLNPDFKLTKESNELQDRVSRIAGEVLGELIEKELESGSYDRVLNLAGEIGNDLEGIVDNLAVKEEIKSVFDMDLIKSQINHNVFDLSKLVEYTLEKMRVLCAPIRDESIKALVSESSMGKKLVGIKNVLGDMKLDLANFKLQALKPSLALQAVDYEKDKFAKRLASGDVKLDLTAAWLKKARDELMGVIESRNPDNIVLTTQPKYDDIYLHAFLTLIFSSPALPETFEYDGKRLFDYQNGIQECSVACALVMLSRNIIKEFRDAKVQERLVKDFFTVLRSENVGIERLIEVIISLGDEIRHVEATKLANLSQLTSMTKPVELRQVSEEEKLMIKNMVIKTLSAKDPFFSLISRRFEKAIKMALVKGQQPDQLKNSGVECVNEEFSKLVKGICALFKFNRDVYGEYYTSILKSIQ